MNTKCTLVPNKAIFGSIATVVGLAWSGAASAQCGRYDLAEDFSRIHNPNGPWSYNLNGSPITSYGERDGCEGWTPPRDFDGSILIAFETPHWDVPNHDWRQGDVTVHAWSFGGSSSVEWTAPRAGVVRISGAVWNAAFFEGRDAAWQLVLDGHVLAERGSVFPLFRSDSGADFANNLAPGQTLGAVSVQAGEVLQLVTYATTPNGHFMGVRLTIEYNDPDIVQAPTDAIACPSGTAPFSVSAEGQPPLSYAWQLEAAPNEWITLGGDPIALPCGGYAFATPPTAAATRIGVRGCAGPFAVRAVVTGSCGTAFSDPALLTICEADFNCDGFVDHFDFADFVAAFEGGADEADFDGDGFLDFFDFGGFVSAFELGC